MKRNTHADTVIRAVQSPSAAAESRLAASWHRSVFKHGLDPTEERVVDRVDASELHHRSVALDRLMMIAAPRIDQLFRLVGNSGCCVLLSDSDGVVLDQRCSDADASIFRRWGLWSGANWSEAAEGTNGIGTCLIEGREVTIHRGEHFLSRNIAMSCMDAPIYGPNGQILAALDVSSCRADQTEAFSRLIAATVSQTARQIEIDHFKASYPAARIIMASGERAEDGVLLAVDEDDLVIGATRAARRAFGLGSEPVIKPQPASDILGRSDRLNSLDRAERAAVNRALARVGGNVSAAARALGIGRATMYRRMKQLGLNENDV